MIVNTIHIINSVPQKTKWNVTHTYAVVNRCIARTESLVFSFWKGCPLYAVTFCYCLIVVHTMYVLGFEPVKPKNAQGVKIANPVVTEIFKNPNFSPSYESIRPTDYLLFRLQIDIKLNV